MARSFFKKIKKVSLSVSLLTSLLLGVFALPLYTVKADNSYQLGLPNNEAQDNKLVSSQHTQNIHNYYDMLWYGLYLQLNQYTENQGLGQLHYDDVSRFFTSLSPSLALLLSNDGYEPSVLVNIYCRFIGDKVSLLIETCPNSLLLNKPSYYVFDNYNINVYSGHLPVMYPVGMGESDNPHLTVLSYPQDGSNYAYQRVIPSDSVKSFTVSTTEHKFFAVLGLSLSDFTFNYGAYYSEGQFAGYNPYQDVPSSFENCLVHSFPYYTAFYEYHNSANVPFLQYQSLEGLKLMWRSNNPYQSNTSYYFSLSEYITYSSYQSLLYPTPTSYPTVLPSVTPTPLPLGYDTDVSGTNDALGYLSTLGDYFTNILSTWTVIPLLATTLGYVFHYSPWFGIALLVPTIALLSLLIGRNKS